MISKEVSKEILFYCQRMDQKGWVANHDGNISCRLNSKNFAVTPTGRSKFSLVEKDLLELDPKGKKISGKSNVFSEWSVHQRVFQGRPEVGAVVHAHSPYAMAVGCANQEMVTWAVPEAVVSLGPGVPLIGLGLPNSEALMIELDTLIPHYHAVMMAGNGVFAWGENLEQAFLRLELVEHLAKVFLLALPLGGPQQLPQVDVSELLKKREKAGLGLPPDPARPHWFSVV